MFIYPAGYSNYPPISFRVRNQMRDKCEFSFNHSGLEKGELLAQRIVKQFYFHAMLHEDKKGFHETLVKEKSSGGPKISTNFEKLKKCGMIT